MCQTIHRSPSFLWQNGNHAGISHQSMDWLVLVFSSANVLFGKFLVFNKHTKQVNQNAKNAWRCPSVSCWLNWWLDWGLKLPYLYFQALTYLKALSRNELNEKTCLCLINTLNDYALILICSSSSSLTWQHISHWLTVSTFIPCGAKLLVGCWRHRHWPAFRLWWFTNSSRPQEQSERYMIR